MPEPKYEISKPKPLTLQDLRKTGKQAYVSGDRLKGRRDRLLRAATKIGKSPHHAMLVPYLVRGLLDHAEGRSLTKLQGRLVHPLVQAGIAKQMLRRFRALPDETVKAFDQQYFKEKDRSAVDVLFKSQLATAVHKVSEDLKMEPAPAYRLLGASSDIAFTTTSDRTIKDIAEAALVSEPECPPIYQLRLEYRGVTTHKISERAGGGGVDPYLVTGVYRIPYQILDVPNIMHEMTAPMKVKHLPENLGAMGSGTTYWSPSGGEQDDQGNPISPLQFHPRVLRESFVRLPMGQVIEVALPTQTSIEMTPLLRGKDLHFAVVSVWEEDGDQASTIMNYMGKGMVSIGSEIMALIPGGQVVGAAIVVIGVVLEVVSLLTGDADDYIGDFVLVFDQEELAVEGYREVSQRLESDEGNDWTIYLGVESKSLV